MHLDTSVPTESHQEQPERYYGLDAVRATAMLLGVFYHLPIAFMGGGMFGGPPSPKTSIDNWLHSFRMPLFFLISGFFACMMFNKYGFRRYFARRWWRIGSALVVSFALLVGFRIVVEQVRVSQANQTANPFPGFPGGGFGPPMGPANGPPIGPGPMMQTGAMGGNPLPPTTRPPVIGFGAGAATNAGPPMVPFQFPGMPSRAWSTYLFGDYSKHLSLEHLWFLWYLLVMVSFGPFVAYGCASLARNGTESSTSRFVKAMAKWNLLGLGMGVIGLPLLIHARGFMGWSLANPYGFSGAFPDLLFQYYPDWPHYSLYFAVGWWLFTSRSLLPEIEKHWQWALAMGVIAFAVSQWLSARYSFRPEYSNSSWIRTGTFLIYGVGAAYSALGFLGGFQRYMNRPSPSTRYLADTALWIYLIHLPLIPYVIAWVEPWKATWWEASIGGMLLVTAICLALYELLVRTTPLIYIYGPANATKNIAKARDSDQA